MLAKSCQWWLIWYLLFFCHGGAEGQLQWVVKEKVTAYGQNLILFCPVENCCSEPAGWSVGHKSIILDVKAFSNDPSVKYHGTYNTYGFGVVIRNLSEADLNVTYRCAYGFDQSTPKHLLHGDVFKESTDEEMEDLYNTDNQTENEQDVPDKDKENDTTTAIVVAIVVTVVVIALIIIGIVAYCVCRSRIKKKRQKQTGTNEKMEVVYNSNNQMENQRDEVEGQSVTDPLLPTTPVDSNPRQSSECIEVEIIQKGPISVGHGGTIRINAKIISNSTGSLKVNWQKTHDNCSTALSINCLKYSGSSCNVNNPELVINNFNKDDAGIYKLEVTSTTETKISPGILLELFGGNQVAVDSADFDLTLLYKLIRNLLTTIPAPISGWGHPPLPQHINEADDIERIRDLRNKLAHNSEFEICDTDFSTHWTDLSQAINRLSKDSLSTNVELMRTKKFDNCTKNEMKEDIRKELKEIQADIADNKQNIADNKQEIHNINTSHIPQNIKKGQVSIASKEGHWDIVKDLVDHNADVNLWDVDKESPLYIASKEGHCDIVEYLVDHNADVNLCDLNDKSPLYIASQSGHCDTVEYLVDHNADVNLCDADKQSPLYIASQSGHCDIVKYLVDHNADVNLCDVDKESPLYIASQSGHCDIVKYLVDHNADVHFCDVDKQSPLYIASKEGHCDIVKYLVDHNADVNLCDLNDKSPLSIASQSGHCDIVKYLVDHNVDVNLCEVDKQ